MHAGLQPYPEQATLTSNYLQWNDPTTAATFADFAQQYLPELYEQEVERFGNRTISGFLRMVGAEMPMTSDQVIWSEQNRLHIAYDAAAQDNATPDLIDLNIPAGEGENVIRENQTMSNWFVDYLTFNEAYALTKSYIENLEDGIKTGRWYHECYTPQGAKIDRHRVLNILKKLAIEEIENGEPCIF